MHIKCVLSVGMYPTFMNCVNTSNNIIQSYTTQLIIGDNNINKTTIHWSGYIANLEKSRARIQDDPIIFPPKIARPMDVFWSASMICNRSDPHGGFPKILLRHILGYASHVANIMLSCNEGGITKYGAGK